LKQPSDERHVIELEGPHGRELLRFGTARAARARYNELLIRRRDVRITPVGMTASWRAPAR
jgi:hypothetical protein